MTFEESADITFIYKYISGNYKITVQEVWGHILDWLDGSNIDSQALQVVNTTPELLEHEEVVFDYCECLLSDNINSRNLDMLLNGFITMLPILLPIYTTYNHVDRFTNYLKAINEKHKVTIEYGVIEALDGRFLGDYWEEHCEAMDLIDGLIPDIGDILIYDRMEDYYLAWKFRRSEIGWYLNNKDRLDNFIDRITAKDFLNQCIIPGDTFETELYEVDNQEFWYDNELQEFIQSTVINYAIKNNTLLKLLYLQESLDNLQESLDIKHKNNKLPFAYLVTVLLRGIDINLLIDNLNIDEQKLWMEYSLGIRVPEEFVNEYQY